MKTIVRMVRLRVQRFAVLSAALLVIAGSLCGIVQAQTELGTVAGTVTDPKGSAVPRADVVVLDVATGRTYRTVTSDSGEFVVPNLTPGEYSVTASMAGFKTLEQKGIILQVGGRISVPLKLEVGQAAEHVEVTGQAPLVQTETSEVDTLISRKDVSDLPLNGRTVFQLAPLVAGANTGVPSSNANNVNIPDNGRQAQGLSVNGQRQDTNTYLLDGVYNNTLDQGLIAILPPLEAIQEFTLETSNFMPEVGGGGAVMNVTLKSGTNKFHGSVFDFLRNSALDAANYFDHPTAEDPGRLPHFVRNQFGGTFGGPIKRDRTFFFVDYQGDRENQGQTFNTAVPGTAILAGNFSATTINGAPDIIYDPATTCGYGPNPPCAIGPNGTPIVTRSPFPNNTIPSNRFNVAALKVLHFIPPPNTSTMVSTGAGIFHSTAGRIHTEDSFDVKVDHQIAEKDSLSARFSFGNSYTLDPGAFSDIPAYAPSLGGALGSGGAGDLNGINNNPARSAGLQEIHTFSPNIQNAFRAAYIRTGADSTQLNYGHDYADQLGIPNVNVTPDNSGFPGITISGLGGIGDSPFYPLIDLENVIQVLDNVTFIHGAHTMKFGGDYRDMRRSFTQILGYPAGDFTFSGAFTNNPNTPSTSGNAFADFLLGDAVSGNVILNSGLASIRTQEASAYAQDTWRVTPKVTINYGIRYDLFTPQTEAHDRMTNFDLGTGQLVLPGGGGSDPSFKTRALTNTNERNFGPRLGIAYKLGDRGTIRASYGIFFVNDVAPDNGFQGTLNPPFVGGTNYINTPTYPQVINYTLDQGVPPSSGFIPINNPTGAIYMWAAHAPIGYVGQWSLGVERELTHNLLANITYVGNSASHIDSYSNPNEPVLGNAPVQTRRPYYATVANATDFTDHLHAGRSHYNALQATLTKRYSNGISFMTSYVWSHMLEVGYFSGTTPQNPADPNAEKRNGDSDLRNRFVFSGLYQLPFGHGRQFGANSPSYVNALIGGWQLGTATIVQSGNWIPVTGGAGRPNRICDGNLPRNQRGPNQWFNASCFPLPTPVPDLVYGGTYVPYGDAGPNIINVPGIGDVGLSGFKVFPWGEGRSVEFRAEAFNLLNTPHFGPPQAAVPSSTAGQIFSTAEDNREIQLVLKISF
jgi:Carboxypeptidase regulatory-like domain/TonB dependent receptor